VPLTVALLLMKVRSVGLAQVSPVPLPPDRLAARLKVPEEPLTPSTQRYQVPALSSVDGMEAVFPANVAARQLPMCALIKVDVEGMEAQALDGARGLISESKPILYLEHNQRDEFNGLFDANVIAVQPALEPALQPVTSPSETATDAFARRQAQQRS
jgi:hypothetical protein